MAFSTVATVVLAVLALLLLLLLVRGVTRQHGRQGPHTQLFYVHMAGCGHCQRFDPVWTEFESRYRTALRDVGVAAHRIRNDDAAAKRLGVTGFPSILLVTPTEAPRVFDGKRTVAHIASFVRESFPALAHA